MRTAGVRNNALLEDIGSQELSIVSRIPPVSWIAKANSGQIRSVGTDESLKKCAWSCPGDVTQPCGGDGTYVSIFYDRTRYTPGPDSIPGLPPVVSSSSSRASHTSSMSTVSQSSVSTSVSTTVSLGTTSTKPSSTPTQTGPAIVRSIGSYSYAGCYTESTKGRALSLKSFADDTMTVEICAQTCVGYIWFGIEYRRGCRIPFVS
ncbi:hypothetical protein ONS95_002698 [Cadophora gregata]|uniref:uncharacterized protein n=1 Tax=Cadophora gregata TaxID=51156 RepID=UPI0026DAC3F7|nr:uncharacterized protein ONS95_002698 [Cadophora gregata]KAK0110038.1 hypothetical protein ONS95_002698 [Cadophora gregata]